MVTSQLRLRFDIIDSWVYRLNLRSLVERIRLKSATYSPAHQPNYQWTTATNARENTFIGFQRASRAKGRLVGEMGKLVFPACLLFFEARVRMSVPSTQGLSRFVAVRADWRCR
jgi:hypothetical protein